MLKEQHLVHLYFNIIGTVIFMTVFYSVNAFVDFAFMDTAANAAGIAVIHSVFNVVSTIILLPFSALLEKLAILTVKDDSVDVEVKADNNEVGLLVHDF